MSLHVVFGAGQIGSGLARRLASEGARVRVVRRSDQPVGPNIEVVTADARDPVAARAAAEGASVIYHCMNPSAYTAAAWEHEFPVMGRALTGAATAVGARLVCLDNLYGYGPTPEPRREATPMRADGRKGRVRIAWDQHLRATPGLRFTVGRAGDFVGPGAGSGGALMSMAMMEGLARGARVMLVGDADAPHAFSYVPDVVEGLAALGLAGPDVEGAAFHLPVVQVSPRALVTAIALRLGVRARLLVLPAWVVRSLGPVVPLLGELRETLYQWDRPFLVDDSAFRRRFPGVGADVAGVAAGVVQALSR
jgi:nucleoside-diphosphate-sugar epimerase